ncbi:MAG: hypothetical protein ACE5G3_00385, partial [Gammaproteobacteria bacterium]
MQSVHRRLRGAMPAFVAIALTACGGGGEGGSSNNNPPATSNPTPSTNPPPSTSPPPPMNPPPPATRCPSVAGDTTPPVANIRFPIGGTLTTNDAILVSGTTSEDECIESVAVNGIDATTDDDFATWQAVVPLVDGSNAIAVTAVDGSGNRTADNFGGSARIAATQAVGRSSLQAETNVTSIVVERAQIDLITQINPVLDPVGDRILMYDGNSRDIYARDLATGAYTLISGDTRGSGPIMNATPELAMDAANQVLYAWVGHLEQVLRIDLATGDRTGIDIGPAPPDIRSIALDSRTNDTLFAVARAPNTIFVKYDVLQLDIPTGTRSILHDNTQGAEQLSNAKNIVFDPNAPQLLLPDTNRRDLMRVDLATGDLTTLAVINTCNCVSISTGTLDATGNRLIAAEISTDITTPESELFEIDLATRSRTRLFPTAGAPPFESPIYDPLFDARRHALHFRVPGPVRMYTLELTSSSLSSFPTPRAGGGQDLLRPRELAYDPMTDSAFVFDDISNRILRVDMASGDRSIVSTGHQNAGYAGRDPRELEFDAINNRLIGVVVADSSFEESIVAVDIATGAQSVLSDGSATLLHFDGGELTIDAARSLAYATSGSNIEPRIIRIDLATGQRSVISDANTGTGEQLRLPIGIAYDADADLLYVGDPGSVSQLVTVDPVTGNRLPVVLEQGISISQFHFDRANRRLYSLYRNQPSFDVLELETGTVEVIRQTDGLQLDRMVIGAGGDTLIG